MLKTIGLEKIQAQGLEGFTFDLLWRKTYNEPFLVRPKLPSPGNPNPSPLPSLKTSLTWLPSHCPKMYHIHSNAFPVPLMQPMFSSHLAFASSLSTMTSQPSLPLQGENYLMLLFTPSLLLPVIIPLLLQGQSKHLLWKAFPNHLHQNQPCIPLCSFAFISILPCYRTSHRTSKAIFLKCKSDCVSPLHKIFQ